MDQSPLEIRRLDEFPRLAAGVRRLLSVTGIAGLGVRSMYLYGGYIRHCLTGAEPFGDVDIAAGNSEDQKRLNSLRGRRYALQDCGTGKVNYTTIDVNKAVFRDARHLLSRLEDFEISALVYSLGDNVLFVGANTLECFAAGILGKSNPNNVSTLKCLCRTHRYAAKGYRCKMSDLVSAIQAYKQRPIIRRRAEHLFVKRTSGIDRIV
jgi:hypothetical protein